MIVGGITIQSVAEARESDPVAFAAIDAKAASEKRRAEWLKARMGKLGGSGAGKLLTPSLKPANNKTSQDYIGRKAAEIAGVASPEIGGPTFRWGGEHEAKAMEVLAKQAGIIITHYGDNQEWVTSSFSDQVGATADGRAQAVWDLRQYVIPVETKCCYNPGEHIRYMGMAEGIELKKQKFDYYAQVQAQIVSFDSLNPGPTPYGIFAVYDPRHPDEAMQIGWWVVWRDEEFISAYRPCCVSALEQRDNLVALLMATKRVDLKSLLNQ